MLSKCKFAIENKEKVNEIIKSIVYFNEIENELKAITGVSNVEKSNHNCSPLDLEYEFKYKNSVYILRAVAVNLDYNTGNYHCFPGVLQLYKKSSLNQFPDNKRLTKRSKYFSDVERTLGENISYCFEYNVPKEIIKVNNMPYIVRENLSDDLVFWLNRKEGLYNQLYFKLEKNCKSKKIYDLAESFLNNEFENYKKQKGRNNCREFKYYKVGEEVILSPLTYNKGGIY